MKYPWILFDADDTIFDFHRSARHALVATMQDFDIAPKPEFVTVYEQINLEIWAAFERQEITAVELRRTRFEKFLDAIGEYRDPMAMNTRYLRHLSATTFLVDGARSLVEELLVKGSRLGLITNGLKEVQRPRISRAKLEDNFEVIVVSDEIGVSKPHAGFFGHAFVKMGSPGKKEVLVVGDSLNSDIQGGNNFGLDTCWFNPGKTSNITEHHPTYEIEKLHELISLVHQ
ncbi:MAG: noncanonical pyrimidine nucleotidase, YjjG family [Saprospiraceae bacterium]|nr:MAG: noncanonical pyrimidine nucleotidase, YjjG family [Saprospiraceae bacterium]